MPVPFRGRLFGQGEFIEADDLSDEERGDLADLGRRGYIQSADFPREGVKTTDMAAEPSRGYKRR